MVARSPPSLSCCLVPSYPTRRVSLPSPFSTTPSSPTHFVLVLFNRPTLISHSYIADEVVVDTSLFEGLDVDDIDDDVVAPSSASLFASESFSDVEE